MSLDLGVVITIISMIIAVASALFAWQAVKTAEKTYSVELISQLYATYQSDEMFSNLKLVWDMYHKIWQLDSDIKQVAIENTNKGVPIREDSATKFFLNLDRDSLEFKAVHSMINFWTYVELLLKRKALSPKEIKAFTSPTILGFLYPMAKAYSTRYGGVEQDAENTLEYAYKILCVSR